MTTATIVASSSTSDPFDCHHVFKWNEGSDYVDVTLARPVYPRGAIVSASIHSNHSLQVTALGVLRLDPRWNKQKAPRQRSESFLSGSLPLGYDVFWMTETVVCEPIELPSGPRYQPPPIVLPNTTIPPLRMSNDTTDTSGTPERLAIVRIHLPEDGPPTLIATSCRCYYALVLQDVEDESKIFQVPIPVQLTTAPNDPIHLRFQDEPRSITSSMMKVHYTDTAHLLTPYEREQIEGEWTVVVPPRIPQPPPNLILTDQGLELCCLMFVSGFVLTPGAVFRCHVVRLHSSCRRISGHLCGCEIAGSNARARTYSWDTASVPMDEQATLELCFPLQQVVQTLEIVGVVQITARVELDVAVEHQPGCFRNVHAEIPCHCIVPPSGTEDDPENDPAIRDIKVLGLATIRARERFEKNENG